MNNSQLPFNPEEFANRIIDGSNSETLDQLYFVGSAKSYIKKVDTGNTLTVKASGNFFSNWLSILFFFPIDYSIFSFLLY